MEQPRGPEASDLLDRLAQQAKKVEDAFAALAQKTDAAATHRDAKAQADWRAMQSGIDQQVKAMQADLAARKQARDAHAAEQHAQAAQARADWAGSYAAAAAEMAKMATLDAEAARREADALKR